MSEPRPPLGPRAPAPLETLLRTTGEALDYPPTPTLASAVRARLEREAPAPRRRWWWRRTPNPPGPPSPRKGERGSTGGAGIAGSPRPLRGEGVGGGGPRSPSAGWRWAAPSLAAIAVALAFLVWLPQRAAPLFQTTGTSLGSGSGDALRQAPAAPPAAAPAQAPAASAGADSTAPNPGLRLAPSPAARTANQPAAAAPAAQAAQAAAPVPGRAAGSDAAAPVARANQDQFEVSECASGGASESGLSGLEPAASLASAQERVGFKLLVPSALGDPDEICIMPGGFPRVELRYRARPGFPPPDGQWLAVLIEESSAVASNVPGGSEPVYWDGGAGGWYANDRASGGLLTFGRNGLRLALRTVVSRDAAVAIAASVALIGD